MDDFVKNCGNNVGKMLLGSLNNQNDSWFVRWAFSQFRNGNYSVYPSHSLVKNVGFGVDGTHCKGINPYTIRPMEVDVKSFRFEAFSVPAQKLVKEFLFYFSIRQRVKVRFFLLFSRQGRMQLYD